MKATVIVVHHGSARLLARCLAALKVQDHPFRLIVAEAQRTPAATRLLRRFPGALHLESGLNNYCRANNLAVRRAGTPYVALLHNDAVPAPDWLGRLLATMALESGLAGVMGKLLFPDGRIASTAHESLALDEPDTPRFDLPGARESIRHTACLYRRSAYLSAGGMDEAFLMYYDDVDLGLRLREKGWRFLYVPAAVAVHPRRPGPVPDWVRFLCNRNRLLSEARRRPWNLAESLRHACLVRDSARHPDLYRIVPEALARVTSLHGRLEARRLLPGLDRAMASGRVPAAFRRRVLRRAAAAAGLEKPALAVYHHAFQTVGGGQKYALRIAHDMRDRLNPFVLTHLPPPPGIWALHGLPAIPVRRVRNPLEAVSKAAAEAPFLLNGNMVTALRPRSDLSIFLCHFPESPRRPPFYAHEYDLLLCNSRYTRRWMQRRWRLVPDHLIHPPVDLKGPRRPKEHLILSVARFERSGAKRHAEMIRAFERLLAKEPRARGWRLILAGGSDPADHKPLIRLHAELLRHPGLPVDILSDLPRQRLKTLYAKASVFWHLCGLGAKDPARREHFGMSVAEAMQNACVPMVFDGGGLREIVHHGRDGFRVRSAKALIDCTRRLIRNTRLRANMGAEATRRAECFSPTRFRRKIREALLPLVARYLDPAPVSVEEVRSPEFMAVGRRVWERASERRKSPARKPIP